MTFKSTSFRFSPSTLSLLKQLAKSENRSLTNMVETLILDRAKTLEHESRPGINPTTGKPFTAFPWET